MEESVKLCWNLCLVTKAMSGNADTKSGPEDEQLDLISVTTYIPRLATSVAAGKCCHCSYAVDTFLYSYI